MSEFRFFSITDYEFYNNRSLGFLQLPITPFQPTKRTTVDEISHELNIPYTVFEILVAVCAIIGNLMVVVVFQRERKLRRRTNYYIVSLAIADLLVGSLGVPFAIMASVGLPTNLHACLFTVSLLVVLCTISIFCLVAVSVDRYWAILYPMAYSRNVRTKTAIVIISMCWVAGTIVGFLPLFGWHAAVDDNQACLFVEVMDYNYLVFLYFATIITPALLMLAFYAHIYKVIVKQVRQIVTMNPVNDTSRQSSLSQIAYPSRSYHGGTMLRVLGAARKRDVKATQNLSIIVLFFMVCWIPLYTINCIKAFCPSCSIHPKLTLFCIILSHLNSAVNPVLYAYHLKDFRLALKNLILKLLGIEIEQPLEAQHRYSLPSQHRLQPMDVNMRNPMHTRIYVDSPIWLRQQQQQSSKITQIVPKCGIVTPCLNNIHQTVAAVASVTTDIESEVWNILEASTGSDPYADNKITAPIPPPRQHRKLQNKTEGDDSPFSYDNSNYTPTSDNDSQEVFLPNRNKCIIERALRDKLRREVDGRRPSTPNSKSDYEIPKNGDSKSTTPNHKIKLETYTPPLFSNHFQSLKPTDLQNTGHNSTSKIDLSNSSIFIVDSRSNNNSTVYKPKFRKSLTKKSKSVSHSRSCASDISVSAFPQRDLQLSMNSTHSNSTSSTSNVSNQHLSLTADQLMNPNNNNNLNYYTFHHPPSHYRRSQHHHEKFTPLKMMSNFVLPPLVKHSSLFQLFQPSISETTQTPHNATTKLQTTDSHKSKATLNQESNDATKLGAVSDQKPADTSTCVASPIHIRTDR